MMKPTSTKPQPRYEPTLDTFVDVFSRYVSASDVKTIIEVGARDCSETLAFTQEYPHAHIYTFECNPQTLPACHAAVDGHPRVTLIPKAIAETRGTYSFFQFNGDHSNPGASSLLKFSDKYANYSPEDQIEVQVPATTLKDIVAEHGITSIDALWLDVQGGELAAIRSLGDHIYDVRLVYTEVEFSEMYADQPLFWHVWRYLRRRGFLLHSFPSKSGYFGDAIFLNRRQLHGADLAVQARELFSLARTLKPLYLLARGGTP